MFFGSYLINHVFEQNVSHGEISYLNAESPGPLKMAKNVAKMANVDKSVAVVESKMCFFSTPFFAATVVFVILLCKMMLYVEVR